MTTRDRTFEIPFGGERLAATLILPATVFPGFLFVHGWLGNQKQYLVRARKVAALGCACLTFDLRGNTVSDERHRLVSREDSLGDLLAAYDALVAQEGLDPTLIGVVGSSYGGYLAAILTTLRPMKWLALRAPALYKDSDWAVPKFRLMRNELEEYRRTSIAPEENRALAAASKFRGDVLIVESEKDDVVPHPVVANYVTAFEGARSLTYRVLKNADHALSQDRDQAAYTSTLVNWAQEMISGERLDRQSEDGKQEQPPAHAAAILRRRAK